MHAPPTGSTTGGRGLAMDDSLRRRDAPENARVLPAPKNRPISGERNDQ